MRDASRAPEPDDPAPDEKAAVQAEPEAAPRRRTSRAGAPATERRRKPSKSRATRSKAA